MGVSRDNIRYRMKKYGIKETAAKPEPEPEAEKSEEVATDQ